MDGTNKESRRGFADWVLVDDLGVIDRYETHAEAMEALRESTNDRCRVEWSADPGEL